MARLYYLVLAEDDVPIVIPEVSPAGVARTIPSPEPYSLLERLAEECSSAELHHFRLTALPKILRQVAEAEARAGKAVPA